MKKKVKKTKLEHISRYVGVCIYCQKELYSDDSFVALVNTLNPISHNYAHYDCMKADDERRHNGIERSSN